MHAEKKVGQQLERANEEAEKLKAQVARAEHALAQAQSQALLQLQRASSSSGGRHSQQHRPALELTTEEDAAADAAAFAATIAPAGSLRLTVCVPNLQRLTRSSSSESLVALAAVAPETALAMGSRDKPKERPRRLLYVCDGSLPVSWLLSMVLRDCDERADLIGLRRPKPSQSNAAAAAVSQLENDNGSVLPGGIANKSASADPLPSGGRMLDLAADLREVAKDGDVLEAVLDENTSQLLREQQERRQQAQQQSQTQQFGASSAGGNATESTELLFAKGGLASKPKPSGASGKEAVVPTAEAFRVQRSVLANWINYKVAPRKCFVGHLFQDLSEGLLLKHLLEVITGEDIEEWAKHHDNPSALSTTRQPTHHYHKSQSPRGFYVPGMAASSLPYPSTSYADARQQQQRSNDERHHHGGRRPHILGKELSKRLMGGGFSDTTAIPNNPRAYAPGSTPDQVLGNRKVYQQQQGDGGGQEVPLGPKEKLHNMEVLFRFMVARHVLPPPPPKSVAGAMMEEEDEMYAEDEVNNLYSFSYLIEFEYP